MQGVVPELAEGLWGGTEKGRPLPDWTLPVAWGLCVRFPMEIALGRCGVVQKECAGL